MLKNHKVYVKGFKHRNRCEPRWEGPYTVPLTSFYAIKVAGKREPDPSFARAPRQQRITDIIHLFCHLLCLNPPVSVESLWARFAFGYEDANTNLTRTKALSRITACSLCPS